METERRKWCRRGSGWLARVLQDRGRADRIFQLWWSGGWSVYHGSRRTIACSNNFLTACLVIQNERLLTFRQSENFFSKRIDIAQKIK